MVCWSIILVALSPLTFAVNVFCCKDWVQYKNLKCFKVVEKKASKVIAIKECYSLDSSATLVTINSLEEQKFVERLVSDYTHISNKVWLALKWNGERLVWTDGSPMEYTNWSEEAVKDGEMKCGQMAVDKCNRGKWIDQSCRRLALIVCQKKPPIGQEYDEEYEQDYDYDPEPGVIPGKGTDKPPDKQPGKKPKPSERPDKENGETDEEEGSEKPTEEQETTTEKPKSGEKPNVKPSRTTRRPKPSIKPTDKPDNVPKEDEESEEEAETEPEPIKKPRPVKKPTQSTTEEPSKPTRKPKPNRKSTKKPDKMPEEEQEGEEADKEPETTKKPKPDKKPNDERADEKTNEELEKMKTKIEQSEKDYQKLKDEIEELKDIIKQDKTDRTEPPREKPGPVMPAAPTEPVPIGFIYLQLPDQLKPEKIWRGLGWEDITEMYAGLFFRAEGGGSEKFGVEQKDNAPRLIRVTTHRKVYDVLQAELVAGKETQRVLTGAYNTGQTALSFLVSDGEVRPRNKAIMVWRRVE